MKKRLFFNCFLSFFVEVMAEERPGVPQFGLLKVFFFFFFSLHFSTLVQNLFASLNIDERGKCARCFKVLEAPKRCGKCKQVVYCSQVYMFCDFIVLFSIFFFGR